MAKRWKKEISASTNETTDHQYASTTSESIEDNLPLPQSHIDDEEMNDES